jgi:hypothetical protein
MSASLGVRPEDPNWERYRRVHEQDRDENTTRLAIGIARDAAEHGYPGDPDAALRVLKGASGAAAVHTAMQPFIDEAITHDRTAERHSADALTLARDALAAVDRRRGLPEEAVTLSDGSSQVRRQVQVGHDKRLRTAATREGRGDFGHHATPPSPLACWGIAGVLSILEAFLLIWPVINASVSDPKTVLFFGGLVALFIVMNEFLPKVAGKAEREAREAKAAAAEIHAIGVATGRAGDATAAGDILGQVDPAHVHATRRKRTIRWVILGAVVVVYAAVMFTRVEGLAAGLGRSLLFSLLAAALITAFTGGAPLVLAWWWSQGNALGDQLREHGAITDESRDLQERLEADARADARASSHAAERAGTELSRAEQAIANGQRVVIVVLQKAARLLNQESVQVPNEDNLLKPQRAIRARSLDNLERAHAIVTTVETRLNEPAPFRPEGDAPDPWEARTGRRAAVDLVPFGSADGQPGYAGISRTGGWQARRRWLTAVVVVLTVAALIMIVVLLMHPRASTPAIAAPHGSRYGSVVVVTASTDVPGAQPAWPNTPA